MVRQQSLYRISLLLRLYTLGEDNWQTGDVQGRNSGKRGGEFIIFILELV